MELIIKRYFVKGSGRWLKTLPGAKKRYLKNLVSGTAIW
jgi:hypothetical protein